jgi:prepilin-type N-terminal cleavage/methylation domain-containing protein
MNYFIYHRKSDQRAFTLIELLVVIAIIAILAALIIPISRAVGKGRRIRLAQGELGQIQLAIEAYKAKTGFYPPDHPGNPVTNQLYYELEGTVLNAAGNFQTLNNGSTISTNNMGPLFGTVAFSNSSKSARSGDEAAAAVNFLAGGLRPTQIGQLTAGGSSIGNILVCSVPWSDDSSSPISLTLQQPPPNLNPWRYVSTNPTNNPTTYDLWVDLFINGQTYRISNWSKQPQVY